MIHLTTDYICKYINKGSDQTIFTVQQQSNTNTESRNEVQMFRASRYVCSNEAAWQILGLLLHEMHTTVTHIALHLPNGEHLYFTEANLYDQILTPLTTTLTAFFRLFQIDEFAQTLLYTEIPKYYTWNSSRKEWKQHLQGTPIEGWHSVKASDSLGRIYTVHLSH